MPKTYPAWQKVNNLINLIWDIDGTLLSTKGLGAGPFCDAFAHHTGKDAIIDKKKLSGFTDFEIALSLMRDAGIQENFFLAEKILKSFSTRLEKVLATNPPDVLGDIDKTLEFTEMSSKFTNAIGTGNFQAGAHVKLKAAGIYKYFQKSKFYVATPELWNRDAIIQSAALENADLLNLVIGDSPRDISSARHAEMAVLAIPTGQHSYQELNELNPDFILRPDWTLKDFLNVIELLESIQN
jgi:phosphoglycolate phosphatase-like HAD superfamily hydrolase